MRTAATWMLTALLTVAFIVAAVAKLRAEPAMVAEFQAFGYPLWFMQLVAVLELTGVALVLVPRVAWMGAGLLACVMVGAIASHLTHGQAPLTVAPLLLFAIAIVVGTLRGWGPLGRRTRG